MDRTELDARLEPQLDNRDAVAVYADRLLELGDPLGDCIATALAGKPTSYAPAFPEVKRGWGESYIFVGTRHGIPVELAIIGWDFPYSSHATVVALLESPSARFVRSVRLSSHALHNFMNGDTDAGLADALARASPVAPVSELSLGHSYTPVDERVAERLRAVFPKVPDRPLRSEQFRVGLLEVTPNGLRQATPQPTHLRPPYSHDGDRSVNDEWFVFLEDAIYVRCGGQQVTLNGKVVDLPPGGVLKLVASDEVEFPKQTPPGFGRKHRVVAIPEGAAEPPWSTAWIPKSKKQRRREAAGR